MSGVLSPDQKRRQSWMATLAKAKEGELASVWDQLGLEPEFTWLRQPEFGLTMLRARAGGTGEPFNLGEATMTRCALRLTDGTAGYGYILSRNARHAELAALCDALLQTKEHGAAIESAIIAPLAAAQLKRNDEESRRANATKVDFLAMERGVSLTSKAQYENKGYGKK
ncbi:MAG: phosphonate C-P lyase system protein PhnG [Pseudomonadota bacterium]|nr:phosphonate C-P lyase system protein PhnG [Pseudomonadota bacterium]